MSKKNKKTDAKPSAPQPKVDGKASITPATPLDALAARPALAGLVSAVVICTAFAGFSLFPLAWVALVPLFAAVMGAPTPRRAALAGFVYGAVLSLLNHHWMLFVRMPAPVGYLAAAPIIGGFFALWAALSRGPGKGQPLVAVALYLLLEHLVNMGPFSFGWYTLGYTQWNDPLVLPSMRLIGAHGVSALILAVNLGLVWWLRKRRVLPLAAVLTVTAALCLAGGTVGFFGERSAGREQHPQRLIMLQINVDAATKEDATHEENETFFANHLREAARLKPKPGDMVVFPETFVSAYLEDDATYAPLWEQLSAFARKYEVWLAFGMNDLDQSKDPVVDRNAFLLMTPEGFVMERYFKRNLVPFGEYVPFRPFLGKLGLEDWIKNNIIWLDNLPGEEATVFHGPRGLRFSSPICFETAFPWQFRQFANGGAQLILTPTNDAWYGKSFLAVQRMAQGVVRSVEVGLPLIQASNSGIGYEVSPTGKVQWRTGVMEKAILDKKLTLSGPNTPIVTPYRAIGSFLELFVLVFSPLSLLWARWRMITIEW